MQKYSVLMSLYYKEKPENLIQAIDSMINQTIKPDEIVMIYDGPLTEELYETMDNYITQYPGLFNVIKNEKNIGLGLSLNKGVKLCKNELIARMDTDDISKLDRCEKQLKCFEKMNIDICGTFIDEFIGDITTKVGRRIVPENDLDIKKFLKKRCPLNHMTVMMKKEIVIQSGNYLDLFWNEDYYLWIRLAEKGAVFYNIVESLVNVRVGNEMYKRRGGIKYFKSEKYLQDYMLNHKIINIIEYISNMLKRIIIQILLPSQIRGLIFKKFARETAD